MATIAPELEATGWTAVDETGRYLRHEARFGPWAIFDRSDVIAMEKSGGRRVAPFRAKPCLCRTPFGAEGRCWKCGRWVG